ncbi:MAG: type II toxin-antitoxin system PemK/MazF family toxin [Candidatus Xenobiia bacterium LiM19]
MNFPLRGEIWLVDFNPSVGTEIQKTRPALIVSNDAANRKYSKVTVIPLTSTIKETPVAVIIEPDEQNCLSTRSLIRVPDICTFDKKRLKGKVGNLAQNHVREVEKKLRIHLALV